MSAPGLVVSGLSHSYGVDRVIREVDLSLDAGSAVALMGPSGCGKTTLLLAAAGILVPTVGEINVGGADVPRGSADARAAFRRARIGLVFQFGELISELTLTENVALAAELAGVGRRQASREARDLLTRVGLDEVHGHKPGSVSGGQAQRAAIARAIVHRPELVLADEPTGALDSESGDLVMGLLLELVREERVTLLVATHDDRVAHHCDRLVAMADGRLVHD